jgi:hypothetical protein
MHPPQNYGCALNKFDAVCVDSDRIQAKVLHRQGYTHPKP